MDTSGNSVRTVLFLLVAPILLACAGPGEELAAFTWQTFDSSKAPSIPGVTYSRQEGSAANPGSVRVVHEGADSVFIPLLDVPREQLRDGRWLLTGNTAQDEATQAGLEIRYYFPGQPVASSRDAGAPGAVQWATGEASGLNPTCIAVSLPWNTVPERAELGYRIDGPGAISVTRMELYRRPIYYAGFDAESLPVAGAIFAGLLGWMAVSQVLTRRGVLRRTVAVLQMLFSQIFRVTAVLGFLLVLVSGSSTHFPQ